ncbi:YciK family oxidoreductase [Natronospira sp. AB-CW4]|uniref:YciK family oxidoreductase n=1 Tax=Natronospira bacteriovora TaxID=3069753 RepID=A0ABU0W574_9GAMM|nr:YciK family oxidoreductase [Natronospira sp. AB-CW4]MDQ2069170.1 YciK family oxidoreductase [Natronospira sp. AB-CW4]
MRNYEAAPDLLKDRVILVTGAGDGIGRAAARTFARHGATVILLGRTVSKLESVYDQIEADGSPTPAIYPMNLLGANLEDYQELAQKVNETWGRLDGLLHNAGILGTRAPIDHYDEEEWQKVMHVNLTAPFVMTKACLPLLLASDDASLVFTSSGVGRKGRAFWGAYAVSKFGTEGLMETLADELTNKENIRINAINPGATRTDMRADAYPAEDPNELLTPEEIMGTYLFLFGRESRGITGKSFDAQ